MHRVLPSSVSILLRCVGWRVVVSMRPALVAQAQPVDALDRLSPDGYDRGVGYTVVRSDRFSRWLRELRDRRARAQITVRIDRVVEGNFGDHRSVGGGVSELRIPTGPGYRVYYTIRRQTVVVLLCGGDKTRQRRDIQRAQQMARDIEGEPA